MKTFGDFIQGEPDNLKESRLLRKGGVLLLARSAKTQGDNAEKSLNDAKQKLLGTPWDSDEERLRSIQKGLVDICDALISIRKQNGANTGIATTAVLFNERTSAQMGKVLNKR
jgi:hypothetical protein